MTETEMKLWDAATQMKLALADGASDEVVRSCINAFISNARSVTLVMQAESGESPELARWYIDESAKFKDAPLLKFFNERRVHSIHRGVVQPKAHSIPILSLSIDGGPPLPGEGGKVTLLRFEGVEDYLPGDSGGVFRLCEQCFLFLRMVVKYWLRKRYKLGMDVGDSRLLPASARARIIASVTLGRYY